MRGVESSLRFWRDGRGSRGNRSRRRKERRRKSTRDVLLLDGLEGGTALATAGAMGREARGGAVREGEGEGQLEMWGGTWTHCFDRASIAPAR